MKYQITLHKMNRQTFDVTANDRFEAEKWARLIADRIPGFTQHIEIELIEDDDDRTGT